ncbi:type 1 glutamine amidotransferase [Arsenicibacter rosenii]|uniref:GMP synthase n=1 Tax=Arsenicibacter rosenii TaxID=1750698 RepID=A0A1S2VGN0_9BACT|nr:GMP synthase [Arsenicibacter rosenii]OIN57356.1 GMP synthase [Arsenicibacter rosenii]
MKQIRLAILDMYDNHPNEGMRCIHQLIQKTKEEEQIDLTVDVFNVRANNELPGLDYDIYVSTGGPGSPLPSSDAWERHYFSLIDRLFEYNRQNRQKKYVFLICHSFQLVARHFRIGMISKRRSTSFGIFPIHRTDDGHSEPYFKALPDPLFAVDSRDFQLTSPNWNRIEELGMKVLALEKIRPHVNLERAIMAVRFSNEIFGTQFHPEADSAGMLRYFLTDEKRNQIVANHGEAKYNEMVDSLQDPDKIRLTEAVIIPSFLRQAIRAFAPLTPQMHN